MCRVYSVSRDGYNSWKRRGRSIRRQEDSERLHQYGIEQSMNRVKQMNDNAFMESFYQQFKTERIKRVTLRTVEQIRGIIMEYMRYYNYERSHSSLGYISPGEFECRMSS